MCPCGIHSSSSVLLKIDEACLLLSFRKRYRNDIASEDANVDMMERSEVMSSAASGSDGVAQTENDDTLSEACSEEDTLNLVEGAILRALKRYSSQQHDGRRHSANAKRVEGTKPRGRLQNAGDEEQHSAVSGNAPPARSSNPEDMELLASLLEQAHSLRRNQRQGSRRPKETLPTEVQDIRKPGNRSFDRRRGKEKRASSSTEELRMTLEAAAIAAKAAADAAEAAAVSVARNTEAIDVIRKSMKSSKKRHHKGKHATISENAKKAILKSNRVTHWILGFIAVTTIAWRFGVVKVVKQVSSKFNDPLGYVGKLIGGNDQPSEENPVEKSSEMGNLFDRLPHVELPSILLNDSDHKDTNSAAEKKGNGTSENGRNDKERSVHGESVSAVDVKIKEAGKEAQKNAFSFFDFLQFKF